MSTTTKMPYVRLGNSGLKVSKIILGCMSYGDPRWQEWVLPEEEAIKHIKYAYDHGITTFDTAKGSASFRLHAFIYSHGQSEIILGNAIKKLNLPRDELVILTKEGARLDGNPEDSGIINQHGLNRKHIFDSVKASLKRLQLDYIDVLQCHRFDYTTPIEETMQALHDVVQAGYVRYIGMSSCHAYQFHQMQNYAITHNLTPFISMQNHYSLIYREEEREMFPTLKLFGVGSIPWSPLGRGLLTRPVGTDTETTRGKSDGLLSRYENDVVPAIRTSVEELAKKKGVSMAQISMAWVLAKPHVSAPIVGTTSLVNLEDILGSLDVKLTEEEIKSLEEKYRPLPVSGHV
ncbi:transporter [Ganoderma sinense ZZ0214-1]|uniref:Transporter n=1 Tax=Ganoderma sinense ZZ0214-1 TaxID=1077348 RepID=A0A2G8SHN3_9APHY|nr:transporter [Ganoderma sinense ZZ0214-1]